MRNEEIDKLLEGQAGQEVWRSTRRPQAMPEVEVSPCLKTDERV